jgi:hypothetical protein
VKGVGTVIAQTIFEKLRSELVCRFDSQATDRSEMRTTLQPGQLAAEKHQVGGTIVTGMSGAGRSGLSATPWRTFG